MSFNPHNDCVWKVLIIIPILQLRKVELKVVSDLSSHPARKWGSQDLSNVKCAIIWWPGPGRRGRPSLQSCVPGRAQGAGHQLSPKFLYCLSGPSPSSMWATLASTDPCLWLRVCHQAGLCSQTSPGGYSFHYLWPIFLPALSC